MPLFLWEYQEKKAGGQTERALPGPALLLQSVLNPAASGTVEMRPLCSVLSSGLAALKRALTVTSRPCHPPLWPYLYGFLHYSASATLASLLFFKFARHAPASVFAIHLPPLLSPQVHGSSPTSVKVLLRRHLQWGLPLKLQIPQHSSWLSDKLYSLFVYCLSPRDQGSFLLITAISPALKWSLTHSRCSINISWLNEWMHDKPLAAG